jgi:hypothetical protein
VAVPPAVNRFLDRFEVFRLARGQHHMRARLGKGLCRRGADPAARAGDERDAAPQASRARLVRHDQATLSTGNCSCASTWWRSPTSVSRVG